MTSGSIPPRLHVSMPRFAGSESGEWILTPAGDKSILIDGDPVSEPIALEVGMNIVLGQDHLRCVTEGLDRSAAAALTAAEGLRDSMGWRMADLRTVGLARLAGWIAGAVTLVAIVWILLDWNGQ